MDSSAFLNCWRRPGLFDVVVGNSDESRHCYWAFEWGQGRSIAVDFEIAFLSRFVRCHTSDNCSSLTMTSPTSIKNVFSQIFGGNIFKNSRSDYCTFYAKNLIPRVYPPGASMKKFQSSSIRQKTKTKKQTEMKNPTWKAVKLFQNPFREKIKYKNEFSSLSPLLLKLHSIERYRKVDENTTGWRFPCRINIWFESKLRHGWCSMITSGIRFSLAAESPHNTESQTMLCYNTQNTVKSPWKSNNEGKGVDSLGIWGYLLKQWTNIFNV